MIPLSSCPKHSPQDSDKALPPQETVNQTRELLSHFGQDLLLSIKRIDTGRLNIPVYISYCGSKAQEIMQTRKQMGKGASEEQAQASALMELVERYSFFSYCNSSNAHSLLTWSAAQDTYGQSIIPIEHILQALHDPLKPSQARKVLDLVSWRFCLGYDISTQLPRYIPLDIFKKINEFNGSSAGNTSVESILQGACEIVERHVCAMVEQEKRVVPTLNPKSFTNPVLVQLWQKLTKHNIQVWLKDLSLDTGIPTVAVLAFDPSTFPHSSEIVLTAGTATSPEKAAIRALTELAQLAGDFETGSTYEPSGLPKYKTLDETLWLQKGPLVPINTLPDISDDNLLVELKNLTQKLVQTGHTLYSLDITHPDLGIPANLNVIPGFCFRERTSNLDLGMVVGRILAEELPIERASYGLTTLSKITPDRHYLPFFKGLVSLRAEDRQEALSYFSQAESLQPSPDEQGLVAFYRAYIFSQEESWGDCLSHLDRAIALSPDVHSFHNLRGVANFKLNNIEQAAQDFQKAVKLDAGSALDLANLGLCFQHMHQPELACEYFKKSLSLDPTIEFAQRALDELKNTYSSSAKNQVHSDDNQTA
jgi:ribosomal protein S12 methylthiotransferase accessory factor